ncbi:sensor histidine kinase [Dyella caseinilytica]|uniref:histidine kinase n=1 Tax=Dyella caseinilytica TaxID=1849581 RepID=A0ABX7GZK9_9GAMM|nr:sensor histidine kinase [Dyella caseinilytica]QRN54590.1 sensor histidine kinase N-terminal domain-containing protein [Dyella caseinilytica]GFZ95427.1 sensor histidine kinase [Dyella caseinilytica]
MSQWRWGRRSLRTRLLMTVMVPLLALLLMNSLITYVGALIYANHVHDKNLIDDTLTLVQLMATKSPDGNVTSQAAFLLEYEPEGRNYFSVFSAKHGLVAGNPTLLPPDGLFKDGNETQLYDIQIEKHALRAASIQMTNPRDATDELEVTVAETLHDRHMEARQILLLSIPAQTVLIFAAFLLVWLGVRTGLRQLDPLTTQLANRQHDLAPIGDEDVPEEILPLTRTIDGLFARLRAMLALQERFIADAAHQLRTPLAGLSVHAERAQASSDSATVQDALNHIQRLIQRANRTSSQLLALTRAQTIEHEDGDSEPLDMAVLIPELVGQRVHEAIAANIDLGYDGPAGPLWIDGDRHRLQEMLDNLIDNSLRYAGSGALMTVALSREGEDICLAVEDNGPGVPLAWIERLGERFFRVPGCAEEGSGLGLAIVQRIAEWHDAKVRYFAASKKGGLRVEIIFPVKRG